MRLAQHLHPADEELVAAAFKRAMTEQQLLESETRYRRVDGVYRILRTMAWPRFAASGRFLGMTGVNVDVTE